MIIQKRKNNKKNIHQLGWTAVNLPTNAMEYLEKVVAIKRKAFQPSKKTSMTNEALEAFALIEKSEIKKFIPKIRNRQFFFQDSNKEETRVYYDSDRKRILCSKHHYSHVCSHILRASNSPEFEKWVMASIT